MPITIKYDFVQKSKKRKTTTTTTTPTAATLPPSPGTGLLPIKTLEPPASSVFAPTRLSTVNPHPLDKTIKFVEESHKYYVIWGDEGDEDFDNGSRAMSTSTLVHQFFEKFDAERIAGRCAGKTSGKYAGMTKKQIVDMWANNGREARERGTAAHAVLECLANGFPSADYEKFKVVKQYLDLEKKHFHDLVPFRTELRMHTGTKHCVTGTADLLMISKTHGPPSATRDILHLTMIDFKFSKQIKRCNNWKRGTGPCASLDDCNASNYFLQQNIYKWMLEKFYHSFAYKGQPYKKTKVDKMFLAVMHDTRDEAELVEVPNLQHIVRDIMCHRAKQIAAPPPDMEEEEKREEEKKGKEAASASTASMLDTLCDANIA